MDHYRLLDAEVERRLSSQSDEWDGIERKGTTILAATGVLLGLVVNNWRTFETFVDPAPWMYALTVVALIAGIVAGGVTIWPRSYKIVPEPKYLLDNYAGRSTEYTLGTLLRTKQEAFERNRDALVPKVWAIRAQLLLLIGAALLLLVVVAIGRIFPVSDQNPPSGQPSPAVTPAPSATPSPTATPAPSATPNPTATPGPTAAPASASPLPAADAGLMGDAHKGGGMSGDGSVTKRT